MISTLYTFALRFLQFAEVLDDLVLDKPGIDTVLYALRFEQISAISSVGIEFSSVDVGQNSWLDQSDLHV